MVKFVESDVTGLPLKRKQVAQACVSCRKRKKRCNHEGGLTGEDGGQRQESASPTRPGHDTAPPREIPRYSSSDARLLPSLTSQESRGATRFVGDLNPEHLFIEATSPRSTRDVSGRGGVGIWQTLNAHDVRPSPTSMPPLPGPTQTVREILTFHVRSRCVQCLPPSQDWHALRDIYFEKLDPLFPVIPVHLTGDFDTSLAAIVVKQVICLAASTSPDSVTHYRLQSPTATVLSRSNFTTTISAAIYATIEAGLLTDRELLIRVLLLYSMYMQPTCPEEADLPSLIFAKAAHQLYTVGLHLPMDISEAEHGQMQSLFLCTWSLDRLNAAFYGRACVIHERDIGWDMDEAIQAQNPPFRLFLLVVRLLERVVGLYRPTQKLAEEPIYIDMPILEQLIIDAGATKVSSPLLASIEVFYHAVAILSCRFPQLTNKSALPSPATNSRRSLSADRITELIGSEFHGQLTYMPTIPYAISLSLSVMYRKMRYSQIPMFRSRGKRAFSTNTALLKELGELFWGAKTMAAMAEQVLQQMDKAVATMAQENGSVQNSDREGSDTQIPLAPQPLDTMTPGVIRENPLALDNGDIIAFGVGHDTDVWGHIDPNFNMSAIDAAIQGNLDFGTSTNWYDWQQSWG